MLQDNDSKFGTLSLVTSPIELQPKVNSHLQIGRTVFNIEIKSNFNAFNNLCCFSQKAKKEFDPDPNQWHTMQGVKFWPGAFAHENYNIHMAKRGYAAIRRNSKKGGMDIGSPLAISAK